VEPTAAEIQDVPSTKDPGRLLPAELFNIGSNLDGGSKLINAQLGIDRGDVHGVSRYLEINHTIAAGCARSGKMTANKVPSATDEVTAILPW